MIIDFHTHNFPDALAARAIAAMVENLRHEFTPFGDGTLACQLAAARADGIDRCVMCPVATKPAQADVILRTACAIRDGDLGEEAARVIIPLASVCPSDADYRVRLKAIADAGIPGIKLHPYYQGFRLDDPRVFPYFAALRDAGLFVVVHCGLDLGFADEPLSCGPVQIAALLRAVPDLTFIAAHLGGSGRCTSLYPHSPAPHATDLLLEFPNCYFDTAVVCCCDDDPESQRVMAEWPAERLLFATDYFWRDVTHIASWVRRFRPNPADLEKIFSGNARRLLGEAV